MSSHGVVFCLGFEPQPEKLLKIKFSAFSPFEIPQISKSCPQISCLGIWGKFPQIKQPGHTPSTRIENIASLAIDYACRPAFDAPLHCQTLLRCSTGSARLYVASSCILRRFRNLHQVHLVYSSSCLKWPHTVHFGMIQANEPLRCSTFNSQSFCQPNNVHC